MPRADTFAVILNDHAPTRASAYAPYRVVLRGTMDEIHSNFVPMKEDESGPQLQTLERVRVYFNGVSDERELLPGDVIVLGTIDYRYTGVPPIGGFETTLPPLGKVVAELLGEQADHA